MKLKNSGFVNLNSFHQWGIWAFKVIQQLYIHIFVCFKTCKSHFGNKDIWHLSLSELLALRIEQEQLCDITVASTTDLWPAAFPLCSLPSSWLLLYLWPFSCPLHALPQPRLFYPFPLSLNFLLAHTLFSFVNLPSFRSVTFSNCSLLTKSFLCLWKASLLQASLLLSDWFSFSFWTIKHTHPHIFPNPWTFISAFMFQFILQRFIEC